MKYKHVYRIEHKKTGRGPYCGTLEVYGAMSSDLPEPAYDDELYKITVNKSQVFGAPTKKMMREWIVDPTVLRQHSYVVRKYKVPVDKVVSSKIQSIFYKQGSSVVEEYDVVEFKKGKRKCVRFIKD